MLGGFRRTYAAGLRPTVDIGGESLYKRPIVEIGVYHIHSAGIAVMAINVLT
jgi:hypothetical protein